MEDSTNNPILRRILRKFSGNDVLEFLSETMTGADLNSLLLEVINRRTQRLKPHDVLREYTSNRFVGAAQIDCLGLRTLETALLQVISERDFDILEFSPVTPLGTSSAIGPIDQKNALSALRGCEVVSDVTNVIALHVASLQKKQPAAGQSKICAVHRHLRCQQFDLPGFTAHFKVLSLVSAGFDQGDFRFEIAALADHINSYREALEEGLGVTGGALRLELKVLSSEPPVTTQHLGDQLRKHVSIDPVLVVEEQDKRGSYYQQVRFKIFLTTQEGDFEIIDGGLVDWSKQLLQNKKARMLISGLGTEYLYRITNKDSD